MKNVLVLGGTQFFGKRLVQRLIEEGNNVTIATRGMTSDPFGDKIERLIIDREDKHSLVEAFKVRKWDVVYDQTCYSPLEALEAVDALYGKVHRYIFTSTMAVYEFGTQHKEEVFKAEDFHFTFKGRREYPGFAGYQEAKRAAEKVLSDQSNMEVVCVRFPLVIGKDDYTDRFGFHVERIIDSQPIGIENLNLRYSFITSVDAAEFLLVMGNNDYVGPINAGCEKDISLAELIQKIESMVGKEAIIEQKKTSVNASPYCLGGSWSINTNRAKQLGFQFADLHETIEELISFYSAKSTKI
ncbi:NAD-dependent epimerase/dehydratase family protein [Bacillus sp. UNCCL13]|nr:NAD-dependent epimerase/dehydratase family protein [Bacillus sp. UNCCL13]